VHGDLRREGGIAWFLLDQQRLQEIDRLREPSFHRVDQSQLTYAASRRRGLVRLPCPPEVTSPEADPSQIPQNLRRIGCLPLAAELGVGLIEDLLGLLELSQEQELDAHREPAQRQLLVRSNSEEERFRFPAQPRGFGVLAPSLPQDGF